MPIVTRAQWGAKCADGFADAPLPAREVWLHHSVTVAPDLVAPFDDDHAAVRTLERIGQQRFGGGISYTFVVTPAGLIFQGHGVDRQGAHTAGRNSIARAICLVGDYTSRGLTPAQMDAVVWLLREGKARGWWQAAKLSGGHRDVKSTSCPGDGAYAAIGELNRRAAAQAKPTTTAPTAPAPVSALPILRYGDHNAAVRFLQAFMVRAFPSYCRFPATGLYGDQTKAGVAEFQRRVGITGPDADGSIVGARTNTELAKHGYRL